MASRTPKLNKQSKKVKGGTEWQWFLSHCYKKGKKEKEKKNYKIHIPDVWFL